MQQHTRAKDRWRFAVVYTLDAQGHAQLVGDAVDPRGDYSFLIARNITDHLSERDHLREVVVVGIGYWDQEPGRTAS